MVNAEPATNYLVVDESVAGNTHWECECFEGKTPAERFGPAHRALVALLTELWAARAPDWEAYVYVNFSPAGLYIAELGVAISTTEKCAGCACMRSEPDAGNLALFTACTDYMLNYGVPAFRPSGWESDLDEAADAEWKLRELVAALQTKAKTESTVSEEEIDGDDSNS
jgi:hypothetical protein